MKARVKAQAAEGAENFGAANADKWDLGVGFENNSGVTTDDGGKAADLKALEGYFDNLNAATTNDKTVLEKLVTSNAKLAATNKHLVAVVKK